MLLWSQSTNPVLQSLSETWIPLAHHDGSAVPGRCVHLLNQTAWDLPQQALFSSTVAPLSGGDPLCTDRASENIALLPQFHHETIMQ